MRSEKDHHGSVLFVKIRDYFRQGKLSEALNVQNEMNFCMEELCKVGIFSAVKYVLQKRGIDAGSCRKPFHTLTPEECARLDAMIAQYDAWLKQN